jgi:methyl-accepting chemotaxis protein
MENSAENRRRRYYIDKEFQKKFIIKFCLLVMLGAVISGVLIYLMSQGTVTTVFENSRLKIKTTADFILPSVLWSSLIVVILVGLGAIFVTLYTSHKISGPLYRIAKDLEKVISGDFNVKFNLRRHDQLQALAENIDKTVCMMREDIDGLKKVFRETEAALEELEKTGDPARLKEARNKLQDINKRLAKFKT